jgi:hypothetical protein
MMLVDVDSVKKVHWRESLSGKNRLIFTRAPPLDLQFTWSVRLTSTRKARQSFRDTFLFSHRSFVLSIIFCSEVRRVVSSRACYVLQWPVFGSHSSSEMLLSM